MLLVASIALPVAVVCYRSGSLANGNQVLEIGFCWSVTARKKRLSVNWWPVH